MHVPTAEGLTFRFLLALSAGVLLILAGCSQKPKSAEKPTANPAVAADVQLESTDASVTPTHALTLPAKFNRWTGDFDGMTKRKVIRALVINGKTGFFYDTRAGTRCNS